MSGLSISPRNKLQRNQILLDKEQSLLFVIDIQEKFRPAIPGLNTVIANTSILLQAAKQLEIPTVFSEQYPKALGATVTELLQHKSNEAPIFSKMEFSAALAEGVVEYVRQQHPSQIVICGVETHVCVLQTALDFAANLDCKVYVVVDAVASRKSQDHEAALRRLEHHGIELITTEMAVFEWLKVSGTAEFKSLQKLIK